MDGTNSPILESIHSTNENIKTSYNCYVQYWKQLTPQAAGGWVSKKSNYRVCSWAVEHQRVGTKTPQVGMMNLIFGQILRRFREENGRGPDTRELLEMRSALAERLGVDVPPVDDEGSDWDKKAPPKSPGPKLGGTPRKQPKPDDGGDGNDDEEDNGEEEKKADGEPDKDDDDAEQNNDTSEKRGEKRTGDEAGVTAGTPATDEDSDGDNSEERARKRVKFVPKEDHTVHVVERIDHGHDDDDDESSDEDCVEDGAAGADAEEEQDGDARVEVEL